nr:phosphotransferase [Microlunatus antarcticus]
MRLEPCDVLARVTRAGHGGEARLELDRALSLAGAGCPVGAALPGVAPLVHEEAGFVVTLWTYHDTAACPVTADAYAAALGQLHAGMRTADLTSPRFTDRIAEAQQVVADPALSPDLAQEDRALLTSRLAALRQTILEFDAPEQLLHGEPHPGNVLGTRQGPVFIDFETLCRGPVEFDLAHAPEEVCEHYPGINRELLDLCRQLVLAMVASWRWDVGDEFPNRQYWRRALLHALRERLPWPSPDLPMPTVVYQAQDKAVKAGSRASASR